MQPAFAFTSAFTAINLSHATAANRKPQLIKSIWHASVQIHSDNGAPKKVTQVPSKVREATDPDLVSITSTAFDQNITLPALPAPLKKRKRKKTVRKVDLVESVRNLDSDPEDHCVLRAEPVSIRRRFSSLRRVLIVHCGGTFGMDVSASFDSTGLLRRGGHYNQSLRPGNLLADIMQHVPELRALADLDVSVAMNKDSARMGPPDWMRIARLLHKRRADYDAFVVIHGTDTLAYTGAALSLMLAGFAKPVVLTGSQLPMLRARSDARQNLIDSVSCATEGVLEEFAICFGGTLLRANRAQKTSSTAYRAFDSPTYPALAKLGVDVDWNHSALWKDPGVYRPRFKLETNVIRIPVVPGVNPAVAYGDLYGRGVRGAVLESFGVGNLPDTRSAGWLDWLRSQRKLGLEVYLASQCVTGPLHPELYRSGSAAMAFGAQATRRMTAETAVIKLMLCLGHVDLHPSYPLAGEL